MIISSKISLNSKSNEKNDTSLMIKIACYEEHIVAVKVDQGTLCVGKETMIYQRAHISFQQTSSCNSTTISALNGCKASLKVK